MDLLNQLKPSLDGARARLLRAQGHLREFQTETQNFLSSTTYTIWSGDLTGTFQGSSDVPPPHLLSILVGETIYNLRAALDYLIYELALLDSGRIRNNTQFPIEDPPKDERDRAAWEKSWDDGRTHPRLNGVSDKHKATIRKFQPFERCEWTRTLRHLSNPDKHRRLIAVNFWSPPTTVIAPSKLPIQISAQDAITHGKPSITFDNGPDVITTLQNLQQEATKVIDLFRAELFSPNTTARGRISISILRFVEAQLSLVGRGFFRLVLWSFDLDRGDLAGLRVNLDFRNVLRAWLRDVERPN